MKDTLPCGRPGKETHLYPTLDPPGICGTLCLNVDDCVISWTTHACDRKAQQLEKIEERNSVIRFRIAKVTQRNYYSIMLLANAISRHEWLAEEYVSGRINEKQFLETLLIEAPNRESRRAISPNDVSRSTLVS